MIELKGPLLSVLLAIVLFPIKPLVHIILMRVFRRKQNPFGFLVDGFLIYALVWLGADLNFNGLNHNWGSEMIAGLSTVAFLSLGYAEVFSMVCRGFSLRIMVDVFLNGPFTMDQVISNYSEGKGVDWLMKKRISGIESLDLVKWENAYLTMSSNRGFLIGNLGLWFKRTLKLGLGG